MRIYRPTRNSYKYLWEKVGELHEQYPNMNQRTLGYLLNNKGICGILPQYTISRYLKKYYFNKKLLQIAEYYMKVGEGKIQRDKKAIQKLGFVWENGVLCTTPTPLIKPFNRKERCVATNTNKIQNVVKKAQIPKEIGQNKVVDGLHLPLT